MSWDPGKASPELCRAWRGLCPTLVPEPSVAVFGSMWPQRQARVVDVAKMDEPPTPRLQRGAPTPARTGPCAALPQSGGVGDTTSFSASRDHRARRFHGLSAVLRPRVEMLWCAHACSPSVPYAACALWCFKGFGIPCLLERCCQPSYKWMGHMTRATEDNPAAEVLHWRCPLWCRTCHDRLIGATPAAIKGIHWPEAAQDRKALGNRRGSLRSRGDATVEATERS